MLDLVTEKQHLAKAESDLVEGEARIARQSDLIDQLRSKGQDVTEAKALLETFQQTLQGWRDHRDEILRTIGRLESGAFEPGAVRATGP